MLCELSRLYLGYICIYIWHVTADNEQRCHECEREWVGVSVRASREGKKRRNVVILFQYQK